MSSAKKWSQKTQWGYNLIAQKFYDADSKQQNKNRDGKKKGFVNNILNIFKWEIVWQ